MEPRMLTDEELEPIRNADFGAIGHKAKLLGHIQAQEERIAALEAENAHMKPVVGAAQNWFHDSHGMGSMTVPSLVVAIREYESSAVAAGEEENE